MTAISFPAHLEPLVRAAIRNAIEGASLGVEGPQVEVLFVPVDQPTEVDFDRLRVAGVPVKASDAAPRDRFALVSAFNNGATRETQVVLGPRVVPYIDGFEGLGDEQPQGVSGVSEVDDG